MRSSVWHLRCVGFCFTGRGQGWRWLEWGTLFVAVPAALRIWWEPLTLLAALLTTTLAAAWWLRRQPQSYSLLWRGPAGRVEGRQLRRLLGRFGLSALLLVAVVVMMVPSQLADLPRTQPWRWLGILAIYPLFSVYPQELIYRAFFFARYRRLFPRARSRAAVSAAAFGFMHLVFQNWPAVLLTLVGGWFFAETYARTRSLRLVWLEHSLYGMLIFTVGLGRYFYHSHVGQ